MEIADAALSAPVRTSPLDRHLESNYLDSRSPDSMRRFSKPEMSRNKIIKQLRTQLDRLLSMPCCLLCLDQFNVSMFFQARIFLLILLTAAIPATLTAFDVSLRTNPLRKRPAQRQPVRWSAILQPRYGHVEIVKWISPCPMISFTEHYKLGTACKNHLGFTCRIRIEPGTAGRFRQCQ
jgi:hypothetical protein